MILRDIVNIGVEGLADTQASKVKVTNVASLIGCVLPILYAMFFYFHLGSALSAMINSSFIFLYATSLLLAHYGRYRLSRIWLFLTVMLHASVLSLFIFTHSSGFHFYFLLLPSCLFLMFDEQEVYEKQLLMIVGLSLFFICDNFNTTEPLVKLLPAAEKLIFSSTMLVVMLEIYYVSHVFTKNNARNERMLKEYQRREQGDASEGI